MNLIKNNNWKYESNFYCIIIIIVIVIKNVIKKKKINQTKKANIKKSKDIIIYFDVAFVNCFWYFICYRILSLLVEPCARAQARRFNILFIFSCYCS